MKEWKVSYFGRSFTNHKYNLLELIVRRQDVELGVTGFAAFETCDNGLT